MEIVSDRLLTARAGKAPRADLVSVILVLAITVLVGLLYVPLFHWLGRETLHTQQLVNGAFLVLFALVICLRNAVGDLRFDPQVSPQGVSLVAVAMLCLGVAGKWHGLSLLFFLLSACLAFAGVVSLLLGESRVRLFLPAVCAFFVFGLLAGLVPRLDWPLRAMAAHHAGSLLATLGVPVKIVLVEGRPAELLLSVKGRIFVVATECNGFGLLTSSLIVATTLAFQYRLPWVQKLSLWAVAVPIAIVCNYVRIVSICLVAPSTPLPYGFVHETLGLIFYFLGLGLIWRIAGEASAKSRDSNNRST
ncbi:MAG TPA: exosortase/archaeosortase family protein [Verrucomicrobiae bacterium]|nr:exosortase/archaeosortase family protein [Verrucomicrobiae bacterium]